ncbi:MAG: leucine-rich repeat domain-containing protein, partial [Pauljensenia sp.]
PDTVTTIGPGAFSGNLLDSVTIPSSVTVVSDDAFSSNRLTSVELSPGLTAIGVSAFEYNNLTSVTVPAGVARIGQRAFGSNNLTEVTLLGAAPEIRQAGSSSPYLGSFGDPRGVVVRFPQQFSADVAGEGGYTSPLWQGYATESFSRGTLTLEAELLGADGRDVALQVSAADPTGEILVEGVPGDAAVTGVTVAAGTYTLSSALPQAALDATDGTFVSDGWTCVAADGSPVTVSAANEVEVGAGDDLTCVAIHRFIADEEEDGDPVTADPDDTTGGEAAVSDTTTSDAGAGDAGPAAASRGLARTGAELPAAGLLALLAVVGTLAVRGRHLIGH